MPVAVMPVRAVDSRRDAALLWAMRRAVDARPALSVVNVATRLTSGGAGGDGAEAGRAALEEGRRAFAELELERADEQLERAARLLLGATGGARADAIEALFLLGRARIAARDFERANDAFRRLLRVDPEFGGEHGDVPPSVMRALERARAAARKERAGHLRIDVGPRPAAIFLDGHYAGVTPAYLADLAAGPHTLRLEADGFERLTKVIELRPGRGTAMQLELAPARKAEILESITARLPEQMSAASVGEALRDLKALLFVDQAILILPEHHRLRGQLFELRTGRRVRAASVEIDEDGDPRDAADALARALYADLDPRAPGLTAVFEEADVRPAGPPPPPLHARWWFWPAVGAVTIAAVAVPVLLLRDDGSGGVAHHKGSGPVVVRF